MDNFVQWLRAQLDEEERIAVRASGWLKPAAYWSLDEWSGRETPHSLIAQGSPRLPVVGGHFTADPVPTVQAEHIVRHDPARVLREIDAKRQLLAQHAPGTPTGRPGMERHCLSCTTAQAWDEAARESNCLTLRLLALPYAAQPGYREE